MNHFSGKIGFDITQKERGRIWTNYQGLKEILETEHFVCEEFNEFPITLNTLQGYRIIIFACPDSSRLKQDEIAAILKYVSLGGDLILLNHAGGDQGRRTNLGSITNQCGISFNNDEVLDPHLNLGVNSYPLIIQFNQHPILQNITNICYRIGCTLNLSNGAIALAFTESSADPPEKPVLALASYGKGHIIASGSYEMFQDEVKGGISYPNNVKLITNLINWLNNGHISNAQGLIQDEMVLPQDLSRSDTPHPNESPKTTTILSKLKNLEKQFTEYKTDIHKLREENKAILTDNIELKEKIKIIELNLADFPDQAIPEFNIEIQGLNSKFKTHSELITKLQQAISLLYDETSKIVQNMETLTNKIQSVDTPRDNLTVEPPLITTAANLMNHPEKNMSPRIIAETTAYLQILQILENQFKKGILTKDQYQQKRLKFEKRITELKQYH